MATTVILLGIAFLTGIYFATTLQPSVSAATAPPYLFWPTPRALNNVTLTNHQGTTVDESAFNGKWSFLFFGYTHCPDICPLSLTVMKQLYPLLQQDHPQLDINMVFVSLDPERDTAAVLNKYLGYFHRDFVGLGGDLGAVHDFARQLGIPFAYVAGKSAAEYDVEHPAGIFSAG